MILQESAEERARQAFREASEAPSYADFPLRTGGRVF
jgi:hypothetical protein